jgi:two-component system cell cycle sensor histidine kinase PleC
MNAVLNQQQTIEKLRNVLPFGMSKYLLRSSIYIIVSAFMVLLFDRFEDLGYQNYIRDLKLETTMDLIDAHDRIENNIFKRVLNVSELATIVSQNPDINLAEFNVKAVDYLLSNSEVRNIALAPDLVVEMVFPRHGNESVIGLNYNIMNEQYPRIAEAMSTGEGIITGPVDLIQGGQVLILRKPIFVNVAGTERPWGIVSVVLDYDEFIRKIGILEFEQRYDLVIRSALKADDEGFEIIYGDEGLLASDPILFRINFPFGNWELAATPEGGWPHHRPDHEVRWFQRAALILMCLFAIWYLLRMFDARRSAERTLHVGIEALDHGFVMFDADRRLVAFNERYKQLAGGTGMVRIGSRYEDIVKANLRKGLIPDAVGREEEWYEEWSQRLTTRSSDNEQILADGRMIRAYDRPMKDGSVVGLRIDITDLKKAQIAAEAANKAKTDFMGVLSHELRTPLTVILGNAKLAGNIGRMPVYQNLVREIQRLPDGGGDLLQKLELLDKRIGTMMASLERSGEHLYNLISEVLDFAKIDSGTMTLDFESTNLASVIDPIVEQLRPSVETKGLAFVSKVDDCDLKVDVKRLQQVLINLLSNATKFTDEGSISLKATHDDFGIVISVSDTGFGIPDEHIAWVFEAFRQVDSTSGRKFGGTGLGLAISRDLVEAHGGQLNLKSKVGKGSTFTLAIPRYQTDAIPKQPDEMANEAEKLVAKGITPTPVICSNV